jgi:hypothetical protein
MGAYAEVQPSREVGVRLCVIKEQDVLPLLQVARFTFTISRSSAAAKCVNCGPWAAATSQLSRRGN